MKSSALPVTMCKLTQAPAMHAHLLLGASIGLLQLVLANGVYIETHNAPLAVMLGRCVRLLECCRCKVRSLSALHVKEVPSAPSGSQQQNFMSQYAFTSKGGTMRPPCCNSWLHASETDCNINQSTCTLGPDRARLCVVVRAKR